MACRVGLEARQVDDGVFRREAGKFVCGGADQQGADEQVVPGALVDDAHIDAMFGLRTAEQVGDIERVLFAQRLEEIRLERGEMFRSHAAIGLAPPHRRFGFGIADDELVLGAAAGMLAGLDDQRAVLRQYAFAVADRRLDQRRGAEIPELDGISRNALVGQGD